MNEEQRNAVESLLIALQGLTERVEKLSQILEEMQTPKSTTITLKLAEGFTPETLQCALEAFRERLQQSHS